MVTQTVAFSTFCFFKQTTAYEVRISDWSSDVCSSDLPCAGRGPCQRRPARRLVQQSPVFRRHCHPASDPGAWDDLQTNCRKDRWRRPADPPDQSLRSPRSNRQRQHGRWRSEEHPSELQSLLRTSYAVSCLNKKNKIT